MTAIQDGVPEIAVAERPVSVALCATVTDMSLPFTVCLPESLLQTRFNASVVLAR